MKENDTIKNTTLVIMHHKGIQKNILDQAKKQGCKILTYNNKPDKELKKGGREKMIKCVEGRNKIRKYLLESDKSPYYFWIDSDVLLQDNTLIDLYKMFSLNDNIRVVSGWCPMIQGGEQRNFQRYICGNFLGNGNTFVYYNYPAIIKDNENPRLFSTHLTTMGCMLMKREVLENIEFNPGLNIPVILNDGYRVFGGEGIQFNDDLQRVFHVDTVMSCYKGSVVQHLKL